MAVNCMLYLLVFVCVSSTFKTSCSSQDVDYADSLDSGAPDIYDGGTEDDEISEQLQTQIDDLTRKPADYHESEPTDDILFAEKLEDGDASIEKREADLGPQVPKPTEKHVEVSPMKTGMPTTKVPGTKTKIETPASGKGNPKEASNSVKGTDTKEKTHANKHTPERTKAADIPNSKTEKENTSLQTKPNEKKVELADSGHEELELTNKLIQTLESSILRKVMDQLQDVTHQPPLEKENVISKAEHPTPSTAGRKNTPEEPRYHPVHNPVQSSFPSDTLYSQPLEKSQRSCLAHDFLDDPLKAYVTVNGKKEAIFHDNGDGKGYLLKGLEQTAMDKNKERAVQFDFHDPIALMSVEFGNFTELRGVSELSVEVRREDTDKWRWLQEKGATVPKRFNLEQGSIKLDPVAQLSAIRFYPQKWFVQPILPRPKFTECTDFDDVS